MTIFIFLASLPVSNKDEMLIIYFHFFSFFVILNFRCSISPLHISQATKEGRYYFFLGWPIQLLAHKYTQTTKLDIPSIIHPSKVGNFGQYS